jgi:sigma-B regulation protein RsbU (phosphoserine phosphatase)
VQPSESEASRRFQLTDLVEIGILQHMQDRFATLGQVSVCICNVTGELLTVPTWGSRFSRMVGTSPRGARELATHLAALVLDVRPEAPTECLDGMTLYATAIEYETCRLGVIVVGTRAPFWPPPTEIRLTAEKYGLDGDDLVRATEELDANIGGTPEAAHHFADGLADTIATLYGQAERIQRQLVDLRTVHELTELLTTTFDLQEILDITVNRVCKALPVKACGIRLLDERTGELVVKAVCNLSAEYLRKGPVLLRENAIDAAAFAGETVYIADAPNDPRIRYPANARKEGIVSGLCVPMSHGGRTVGVLRVYTSRRYEFPESERALLRSIGTQSAAAIISHRHISEQAEAERVRRQLRMAGEIQRRMLPAHPPKHMALSFGHEYAPTLQVGGDFFDFIELPGGHLGVCIADVAGKGVPAALLMSAIRSALRAVAREGVSLSGVLEKVNLHLCRDTPANEFATLMYGVFSPDGRLFQYANAGHVPPLLLRDGVLHELNVGGIVIGVDPQAVYQTESLSIRAGDCLVMTTDGVTEALSFEGAAYGRERLGSSVFRHKDVDAASLARQILWDVRRFVGLADQSDDITVVTIKAHQ